MDYADNSPSGQQAENRKEKNYMKKEISIEKLRTRL